MKPLMKLLLPAALVAFTACNAQSETLTVSSGTGEPGNFVTLTITLGDNSGVAGAAFTLDYDTTQLEIYNTNVDTLPTSGVRSDFFPLFSTQGITDPSSVVVDSVTYDKALVVNSAGTMIAAARATNVTANSAIIFEIDFKIKDPANAGFYDVSIVSSEIYNELAGYTDPNGTAIPMLVGIDEPSADTYEYNARTVTSNSAGTIEIFIDSDGDDINDGWEELYLPEGEDLTYFTKTGDVDGDGYTNYQEYYNAVVISEADPEDAIYDPTIANASGGTGYTSSNRSLNHLFLFFLDD